jgi:hypothetical protein
MEKFLAILFVALTITALTAGFPTTLHIHNAIGPAAMAAEAGDGNYDYICSVPKGAYSHLYRYAIHIDSGTVWNPTMAAWSASTAWADGMMELTYVDRLAGYPDDIGFGGDRGGKILLYYFDVTTGPEVEPLKRVQVTWDKHSKTIERGSLVELD